VIKFCPIRGKYCDEELCALWVSSSQRCTFKDLAHSVKQLIPVKNEETKEIEIGFEKDCANCKHMKTLEIEEPCKTCNEADAPFIKWESNGR